MSKGVIPGTLNAYKKLSEKVAEARYKGEFPWHLIRDVTRKSVSLEAVSYYASKELTEEEILEYIKSFVENYYNVQVNPWDDQPKRVIVLVEKEALFDTVSKVIREVFPHGVYKVVATKGYDSATNAKELADDIRFITSQGKTPVVLSFGDFDPNPRRYLT